MDKKAWIVVSMCIAGIFFHMYFNMQKQRQQDFKKQSAQSEEKERKIEKSKEVSPVEKTDKELVVEKSEQQSENLIKQTAKFSKKSFFLENEQVRFDFSNLGGGLSRAILKNHLVNATHPVPIEINIHGKAPIGMILQNPNSFRFSEFKLKNKTEKSIVFAADFNQDLLIEKKFYFTGDEQGAYPYLLGFDIIFNLKKGRNEFVGENFSIYAGGLGQFDSLEDLHQVLMLYNSGGKQKKTPPTWFDNRKYIFLKGDERTLFYQQTPQLSYFALNNQFFTIALQSREFLNSSVWAKRFINKNIFKDKKNKAINYAMEGAIVLPSIQLDEQKPEDKFSFRLYIGPKEYTRLKKIDQELSKVVDYGIFGFISRPLLSALKFIAGIVKNYGVAIIIITFILRILMWPLHHKSVMSMKRMAKLNPIMQELRVKYKDKPQKLNREMMGLYRQYGINPLGGCLPMLLQIPIFIGFFYMLRSAVELRQESFLWVNDLLLPDTVMSLGGFNLNPLPIFMAVTMVLQMALTPKTGDSTQQKIFMFMPIIFLFICYNFASALSLYWTTSNIFSIIQTLMTKNVPEPELKKRPPRKKFELPNYNQSQKKKAKKKPKKPRTGG